MIGFFVVAAILLLIGLSLFPKGRRISNIPSPSISEDISAQLAELARLHENGDITSKEYEQAKTKVLGN